MISLFVRDHEGAGLMTNVVNPGAEWVVGGEGLATRKYDGTCCLVSGGSLFSRRDRALTQEYRKRKRSGYAGPTWEHLPPPYGWGAAQEACDPNSGHWPGWLPVGPGPEDRYHREAWAWAGGLPEGTYELLGPKIQGNPEHEEFHRLQSHRYADRLDAPRDFAGLVAYFAVHDIEGIVWHHLDGRMVKIKGKDFGIKRQPQASMESGL